ncbi:MAG: RNA polymerase sigma factor [Halomonas sp.]|nr:RNA polymerase sigma factor [Halomonas sp.]TVP52144.1 MAG: RNA polymerase sigma factor [Halomonas sp.]
MSKPSSSLLHMFNNERQRLVKRIRHVVGSASEAEDLAQETFLKLWQRPTTDADTPGLLHRTAHNLALDHLRAQAVRQRHQEHELHNSADHSSQNPSPEKLATTLQQWQRLIAQLDTLPERAKEVFLLNRVEGETYTAIAERLGVSISTVEKDMMRAMRLCRKWQQQVRDEEDQRAKRYTNNNTTHSQKR